MAKEASALTLAIRQLCDETNGEITHGQSRARLKKMGFEIAPDPGRRSDHIKTLDGYDIDYEERGVVGVIEKTLGVSTGTARKVLAEMKTHIVFKAERNNFDVTKYNWGKAKDSGKATTSRKPAATPNAKPAAAAASKKSSGPPAKHAKKGSAKTGATSPPAKRRRPAAAASSPVASGDLEALAEVERLGGLSKVEESLAEAKAEVTRLEGVVSTVQALTARVTKAA